MSSPAAHPKRSVLHRLLVCAAATLCLPLILGLTCCLTSGVKRWFLSRRLSTHAVVYRDQLHRAPQPPPRCPIPQKHSAFPGKGILNPYFAACIVNMPYSLLFYLLIATAPCKPQQKTEVS